MPEAPATICIATELALTIGFLFAEDQSIHDRLATWASPSHARSEAIIDLAQLTHTTLSSLLENDELDPDDFDIVLFCDNLAQRLFLEFQTDNPRPKTDLIRLAITHQLVAPFPDRLTALESRVSALEGRADVVLKLVTEMDEGDEGMEGRVRALADRLVVLERAAFVRALPPEPNMGDEIIRGLTELRDMLRDRTVPDCNCGAQDRPDHSPHKDCCRVYTNEAQARAVDTPEIKARPLTLGDVEVRGLWNSQWHTATAVSPDCWLHELTYTDKSRALRNRDTKAPLTEAEFLDICRRERDKEIS